MLSAKCCSNAEHSTSLWAQLPSSGSAPAFSLALLCKLVASNSDALVVHPQTHGLLKRTAVVGWERKSTSENSSMRLSHFLCMFGAVKATKLEAAVTKAWNEALEEAELIACHTALFLSCLNSLQFSYSYCLFKDDCGIISMSNSWPLYPLQAVQCSQLIAEIQDWSVPVHIGHLFCCREEIASQQIMSQGCQCFISSLPRDYCSQAGAAGQACCCSLCTQVPA